MDRTVVFLHFHILNLFNMILFITVQVYPRGSSQAKPYAGHFMLSNVLATVRMIFMKQVNVF